MLKAPILPLRSSVASFWIAGGALTLARIIVLIVSEADLGPDEAQYWYWSRDLAFGYFSKPPLIAWSIAATTALFGNSEWAVRLSAPLFHFGAAAFLYLSAKSIFNRRIAYWTGLGWLTIPGVILSSFLITTDAPLLFFWSGALYFALRIASTQRAGTSDFAMLGAMIGLGLLSKYAMAYFIVAGAAAAVFDAQFRRKILQPRLLLTCALVLALIAPNLWWNAGHDFQTLSHTAANANWRADWFRPLNFLWFFSSQFAVAGVIPFAALLFIAVKRRFDAPADDSFHATSTLLFFALTPLAIVSAQALISRAHANWAAAAYPAAILLVTAFLFRHQQARLAKISVLFHASLFFLFSLSIVNFAFVDRLRLSGVVKDIRGWSEQTQSIAAMADGYDAIVIDDRPLMGEMLYYRRRGPEDIVAIDPNARIDNHYEAFKAFDPASHKRVLFITTRDDAAHVDYRFKTIVPLGPQTTELGSAGARVYHLFDISDYFGRGGSAR